MTSSDGRRTFVWSPTSTVPAEFRGLYDYLQGRFADRVVLSFVQIEDLTGAPLPPLAYSRSWWETATADGTPSSHSRSWTEANRTAEPNVLARNVTFDRRSDRSTQA